MVEGAKNKLLVNRLSLDLKLTKAFTTHVSFQQAEHPCNSQALLRVLIQKNKRLKY